MNIILASKSPMKKEVLEKLGLEIKVEESGFDEKADHLHNPEDAVKYLALEKARAVARKHPADAIIGTDTIIYHNGNIIGKPKDEQHARQLLKSYIGKPHAAYTGIAVIYQGKEFVDISKVTVHFRELTDKEIDVYIATGEPFGKAGAYAYQYRGAALIHKMDGDYYAALGMPIFTLVTLLRNAGINPLTLGFNPKI